MVSILKKFILSVAIALYVLCASASNHINDSGTWRFVSETYINDSGTWRAIKQAYVNDSGTWRTVYIAPVMVTIGTTGSGGGYCNLDGCTFGSVNQSEVLGATVRALFVSSVTGLEIYMTPTGLSQSLFTYVDVEGGDGTVVRYDSASATFFSSNFGTTPATTFWRLGGATNHWTSADVGEVHYASFGL